MKYNRLLIMLIAVFLVSCYDEYRLDYDYTTVAFSPADGGSGSPNVLWRTVVKGEGLKLDIGIFLAGVIENQSDRWTNYTLDPELLVGTPYELLPTDYYSLSNQDQFIIPAGEYVGRLTITLDSANFINDPLTLKPHYAIPFRLTESSADSVLSGNSTKIVVIKYINAYEGYYNHELNFVTYSADGQEVRNGNVSNVLISNTLGLDTVYTDGIIYRGPNNMMKLLVDGQNQIYAEYLPNPNPDNAPFNIPLENKADVALTTSYVSSWENIEAIRNGIEPTSSLDKTGGAYGNWPSPNTWQWVMYDFGDVLYNLTSSEVYWWTDEGGILIPDEAYLEYWDLNDEQWKRIDTGVQADGYNVTSLEGIQTNKIRIHAMSSVESVGILEWKVFGVPIPTNPEQAEISSVTLMPEGPNTFDKEKNTYTLKYRIDYLYEDYYTIVTSKMVWRNRIRDGVNEWRR